jgi:hypothetical protein
VVFRDRGGKAATVNSTHDLQLTKAPLDVQKGMRIGCHKPIRGVFCVFKEFLLKDSCSLPGDSLARSPYLVRQRRSADLAVYHKKRR